MWRLLAQLQGCSQGELSVMAALGPLGATRAIAPAASGMAWLGQAFLLAF